MMTLSPAQMDVAIDRAMEHASFTSLIACERAEISFGGKVESFRGETRPQVTAKLREWLRKQIEAAVLERSAR